MSQVPGSFSRREVLSLPVLGAVLALPRDLQSLEPGKPSRTAVLVAASRAIGSRNPDEATRNPDYLAEKLLSAEDWDLIKGTGHYNNRDATWPEVMARYAEQRGTQFANHSGFLPNVGQNLRTRHFDASVRDALEDGTEQIVILGAGLDSRAYRLTNSWETGRVFEVDFPPTQELKKRKVEAAVGTLPRNLTYVPIDFTKESIEEVLGRSGYRSDAKTLITWEGVSMYLPEAAVRSTLAFVARHAGPGSSVVFDYFDERLVAQNHDSEGWKRLAKMVAEWEEPWVFGIPNSGKGNVLQLVASEGLEVKSDFTMGELCVKYLPPKIMPATQGLTRWAWRICHATQGSAG